MAVSKSDAPSGRIELLQGTLDLLILQTLRWGKRHGYGIAQMIRTGSRDALQVDTGSLYPALHRLERKRAVAAEWEMSENNQRVRVYRLTTSGARLLAQEKSRWEQLSEAIGGVLMAPSESEP
ncbi:MAG TPA: PadR family transcriptional regulator [Thermoanaerobaculia bacterium]|nr:PadR family transcriptional regulator [Thermoanaerobaculia bacterium]